MQQTSLNLTAKTFSGLEKTVAGELAGLGAARVKAGNRAVNFQGDHHMMMKANLWSRASLSILMQINDFKFDSKESFFAQMLDTDWSDHFDVDKTISVYGVAYRSDLFKNTMFLGQLTKDAIADHFRNKTGRRPDVDSQNAQVKINVYVNQDRCVVSLDSSGDPLFKRGYRRSGLVAPINESLAAGLIMLSEWDGESAFLDPMCGSGTFSVEAALISANVAPGLLRREFGFMNWKGFDKEEYMKVTEEARSQQRPLRAQILASDINIKGLDVARQNIMEAGFLGQIRVQKNDFFTFQPAQKYGWLILNPPYGQRMRQHDLSGFYREIGDTLKNNYAGFRAGIISQEYNALRHVGLKPRMKFPVFNGALECRFVVYDLFQGSHKDHVVSGKPRRPRL